MSDRSGKRADIQGLRAVAVLSVVLFHAWAVVAPGGYVGVDVFFVISGYLITQILQRDLTQGRFSLASFYARRSRRLFPALFSMLAAVAAAGYVLLPSEAYREFGASLGATTLFASNFYYIWTSGYFAPAAELRPLLHTWSLGVEEQFYLAYPIALFILHRYARRHVTLLLLAATLASLTLCVMMLPSRSIIAFYFPATRAFELGIGALAATGSIPKPTGARQRSALAAAGLCCIFAAVSLFGPTTPFPGFAALLPCVGAGLVLVAESPNASLTGRLLGNPVLRFFGDISYSLYLWHWPLLVLLRYRLLGEPSPIATALMILASVVLAWLSWRFIEQPTLRRPPSGAKIAAASITAMCVSVAVAMMIKTEDGMPQRFGPRAQALFAAAHDFSPARARCHDNVPRLYRRNCVLGAVGAPPSMAVWADSFGVELAAAIAGEAQRNGKAVMQITASSCPPGLDYDPPTANSCAAHNRKTLDALRADPRIRTVVMAADYIAVPVADRSAFMTGFASAARAVRASGKRLIIVYPIPRQFFPAPVALGMRAHWGVDLADFGLPVSQYRADTSRVSAQLDRLAADTAALKLKPAARLCGAARCNAWADQHGVFYFDEKHLSMTGARFVLGLR